MSVGFLNFSMILQVKSGDKMDDLNILRTISNIFNLKSPLIEVLIQGEYWIGETLIIFIYKKLSIYNLLCFTAINLIQQSLVRNTNRQHSLLRKLE